MGMLSTIAGYKVIEKNWQSGATAGRVTEPGPELLILSPQMD